MIKIKPNRRSLQFSLRAFLVLGTALAVWLGWQANRCGGRLKRLEIIFLRDPDFTQDDVERLKTVVPPGCQILSDYGVYRKPRLSKRRRLLNAKQNRLH